MIGVTAAPGDGKRKKGNAGAGRPGTARVTSTSWVCCGCSLTGMHVPRGEAKCRGHNAVLLPTVTLVVPVVGVAGAGSAAQRASPGTPLHTMLLFNVKTDIGVAAPAQLMLRLMLRRLASGTSPLH